MGTDDIPHTRDSGGGPLVSIVVANWEGESWITRALSSLQASARASGHPWELIVVDDASTDASVALVKERFPKARLIVNAQNAGFRRTVMRGVRASSGRVLVLCNNDLAAREEFIGVLVAPLLESSAKNSRAPIFGVSARTLSWYDGTPNQVCMGAVWRGGRITPAWSAPESAAPCLFVQAGAAAYDRALFMRLGGLSGLYEPGYWEDYDLSYRAARRGWRQIYEPRAVALHIGGGSMTRRFGAAGVAKMRMRNHLIFEWRNLRSPRLLAEHAARLPFALARGIREGSGFPEAFNEAIHRMPRILRARIAEPTTSGPTDEELLDPWRAFTPSF